MADSLIPVTCVILAGGENRRIESPKAFIKIGGISIIERQVAELGAAFDELLVISNDPKPYRELGLSVLPDAPEFSAQRGPLTGVYTGLKEARNDYILALACDMPFVCGELARALARMRFGHDAVVPVVRGYLEPLFAVYSRRILGYAESALREGRPQIQKMFKSLDVLYVDEAEVRKSDPELLSFVNVNTPEDLKRAEALAREISVKT